MPRRIVAGNWKMNGTGADLAEVAAIAAGAPGAVETILAPPATLLHRASAHPVALAAQDCHAEAAGAHTGDLSAAMLREAGASAVILGHSERRADHGETDADVQAKAGAARAAGLAVIVCVGETLEQRDGGAALETVRAQIAGSLPDGCTPSDTVVAYEPVWAIGTGRTAEPDQIAEIHAALRAALADRFADGANVPLLYGGSVKAANAAEIFAVRDVDGALVGGASLKAADFLPIAEALAAS